MNLAAPPSIRCRTEGFAGYAVKFSPFYADRLAVASAQNFGLVGNGRLHLLSQNPASGLQVDKLCAAAAFPCCGFAFRVY